MTLKHLLVSLLALSCLLACDVQSGEETRILFIGNSYTGGMRGTFTAMAKQLLGEQIKLDFITPGGCTLTKHLAQEKTIQKIKDGKWTFVVLQDQSQVPSLGGQHEASFHDAVKRLSAIIKGAGAKPALYMTWGRRDGDKKNAKINPDYETMQKRLTAAYTKAAKENDCILVPAGEVWSAVRKSDPELGKALYRGDGSHPSGKGAFLISSVFLKVLLKTPTKDITYRKGVTDSEAKTILKAVDDRCK